MTFRKGDIVSMPLYLWDGSPMGHTYYMILDTRAHHRYTVLVLEDGRTATLDKARLNKNATKVA